MNFLAEGRSNYYRADVGFTPRTDTNYLGSFIQYTTDKDQKKAIIYKQIWNETNIRYDWKGRTQYSIIEHAPAGRAAAADIYRGEFPDGLRAGARARVRADALWRPIGSVFRSRPGPLGQFDGADNSLSRRTPSKQLYLFFFTDYTSGQMEYDFGAGPDFPRVSRAAQLLGQNAPYDPGPGDQLMIESTIRYQPTSAFRTQLNYNKIRLRGMIRG